MMSYSVSTKQNLKVAILGPGGIGGFLAALFWKKGISVVCVTKSESAKKINEQGIYLESEKFGNFKAQPFASSQLDFFPDIIFITTKATTLEQALGLISAKQSSRAIVIPLLNGFEHLALIRQRLGSRVAAGMIGGIEAQRVSPGHIKCSVSNLHINLASNDIGKNKLEAVASLLSDVGIPTTVLNSENEVIWKKLVRLNAIACVTTASQSPLGLARTNPVWKKYLKGCLAEGVKIAKAEKVDIDSDILLKQVESLPDSLTTSMQRDVAEKKVPEVEAIAGAIVRLAKKHKIACPNTREMYKRIKEMVKKYST